MQKEPKRARQKAAPRKTGRKAMNPHQEMGEMFHQVLELSSEGIFVIQNGRVRQCNGFLDAAGGYLPEEVHETVFASFFHQKSVPAVDSLCTRCPSKPFYASLPNMVLMSKNGRRVKVVLKAQACLYAGKPAVLVVLSRARGEKGPGALDDLAEAQLLLEEDPLGVA
jgi:hypothetical protein